MGNMYNQYSQPQQIVRVSGENGAKEYKLPPNSSALLLDINDPILYLVMTDGAGYKTITPYTIEKYTATPEPSIKELCERVKKLEEKLDESYNTSYATAKTNGTAETAPKQQEINGFSTRNEEPYRNVQQVAQNQRPI